MSYEPTNWQAGDIVTSAKLNKIEQGIASRDMVEGIMEINSSIITLNKTWQEIWDNNYTIIVFINKNDSSFKSFIPILTLMTNEGTYTVMAGTSSSIKNFTCNSPYDYPTYNGD